MILDLVYTSKNLYISNQVKSRSTYLSLGLNIIDLYARDFHYLVNTLTLINCDI